MEAKEIQSEKEEKGDDTVYPGTSAKVTPPPTSAANKKKTYMKQAPISTAGEPLVKPTSDNALAIFKKAGKRALGGGIPGAAAGLIQVRF